MPFPLPGWWLSLSIIAGAQAPGDVLEGRQVYVVQPRVEMYAGPGGNASKVVGQVHDLTLQVLKVQGDYLAVRSSGVDGWIKRSDVVPHDKAVAYFTERIRANPRDGYAHAARGVAQRGKGAKEEQA